MSKSVTILGLESSCDETSCSVVADGLDVRSNVVSTQIDLHARFGGVVPEIASRAHIEAVNTVVGQALETAGVRAGEIDAVAVTAEPGLIGSLLVGLMAAKTLAWAWDVPLIGVNHVYAHAYAAALRKVPACGSNNPAPASACGGPIEYPAVALICSGGHTALYRCSSPTEMELLGTTIDDAAGEAFDKVASILKLGFPGGPAVERAAKRGDPAAVDFPRTLLDGQSLDFSFSGLKTAVLYHVNGLPETRRRKPVPSPETQVPPPGVQVPPSSAAQRSLGVPAQSSTGPARGTVHTPGQIDDIAASFQAAVIDVLRIKLRRAVTLTGARTIVIGGGVSANAALRAAAAELADKLHCTLRLPPMEFCVDNGAMIAGLGFHYYRQGRFSDLDLEARATVRR